MAWQDQYRRMERWLSRIECHSREIADQSGEYEDFLWSYFQNAWHLKDWIKNDPAVSQSVKDQVYSLVDCGTAPNSDALKVASDLANGTKHFQLDRPRVNAAAANRAYSMHVGSDKPDTWDFIVSYDGGKRDDAMDVARAAKAAWDSVLQTVGLSL